MQKIDLILGLQWGDEGKGKIVDLLADRYDIIARFQGGPNAGHTIIIGDKKYVLHQIPSGMTRPNVMNVIGNAVVLDPIILRKEIESLENAGIEVKSRLLISRRANLILPGHRLLDSVQEKQKDGKVGTTMKGIGPTYGDKTGRFGLRVGDLHRKDWEQLYLRAKARHQKLLFAYGHQDTIDDAAWMEAAEYLRALSAGDVDTYLQDALKAGKTVLAEGAQGTLLDIDFGTYPFVTSSNTVAAAACTGLGVSPKQIGKVFGIFKAYCTRVGEGPFPTELLDETGEALRQAGREFGSTTGRPRRCGWLDIPALEYACRINGVDELFMMKIDVMNELSEVQVATSYRGEEGATGLAGLSFGETVTPEYETLKGWQASLAEARKFEQMPEAAQGYIRFIEEKTGFPVSLISVGPERDETILR